MTSPVTATAMMLFVCLLCAPTSTSAQSTLTDLVRDTSGAVLPGVTVEASSDALIEKSKVAISDGGGRYTIADLRPGTYIVVFSLRRTACQQSTTPSWSTA
jgi:hypothetical protein